WVVVLMVCLSGLAVWGQEWRLADPSYRLELPRDHASHPDYRLEWWYYTGNVSTRSGRRFGFQVTFFRVGIDARPVNPSRWAVRDLFIAHLAVSDIEQQRFHFADVINRAGVGWAGAATDRYEVWNEQSRVSVDADGTHVLHVQSGVTALFTKNVSGGSAPSEPEFALDLRLQPGKPWSRNGRDGYSQKGAQAGNASHYYSLTRMPTAGRIRVGNETFDVTGDSWMDHEFGSSFLEPGQQGWDWFSLQLANGWDLMLYRFRRSDGRLDPFSTGALVDPSGRVQPLEAGDFRLTPGRTWMSTASGATYPVEWSVEVPRFRIALTVRSVMADQELRTGATTGVSYWEGSVIADGRWGTAPVRGVGYLEMTGYTGRPMSEVMR
ncbi:MAG: lipocalin-like domain-containing protein, partial [Vicinamibacterales bacterium]